MKFVFWCVLFMNVSFILEAETLEFVFSEFPPFEYLEERSEIGINIIILQEACNRLHITPKFRQLPWQRALGYVKHGRTDAIFSLFKNNERLKYLNYPDEHINSVKMILIAKRESDIDVIKMEDLKGKTIGVYRGSSYGKEFDNCDWIIKDLGNTNEALLKKLAVGRTHFVVMDERVAKYWYEKLDMKNKFKIQDYVIFTSPTYVAFSKIKEKQSNKGWARKFSAVLKKMKNDGFMENLKKKYEF